RKLLQDIGRLFEKEFGEFAVPVATVRPLNFLHNYYSFGSVRRAQSQFYRGIGAYVIEVVREGARWDGTESEDYDRSFADMTLVNPVSVADEANPEFDREAGLQTLEAAVRALPLTW